MSSLDCVAPAISLSQGRGQIAKRCGDRSDSGIDLPDKLQPAVAWLMRCASGVHILYLVGPNIPLLQMMESVIVGADASGCWPVPRLEHAAERCFELLEFWPHHH